jgi:hypothetical protein
MQHSAYVGLVGKTFLSEMQDVQTAAFPDVPGV